MKKEKATVGKKKEVKKSCSGEKLQKQIDDFAKKLPKGSNYLIMVGIDEGLALKISGTRADIIGMMLVATDKLAEY